MRVESQWTRIPRRHRSSVTAWMAGHPPICPSTSVSLCTGTTMSTVCIDKVLLSGRIDRRSGKQGTANLTPAVTAAEWLDQAKPCSSPPYSVQEKAAGLVGLAGRGLSSFLPIARAVRHRGPVLAPLVALLT